MMLHQSVINQLPGLFSLNERNSAVRLANKIVADYTGFKSPEAMQGTHYEDMNCGAAEHSDNFRRQDQIVMSSQEKLQILSYHMYPNYDWRLLFGEKSPYYEENEVTGVLAYWNDVTDSRIIDLGRFLMESDPHQYHKSSKLNVKQFSYIVGEYKKTYNLSDRELETLFFALRGFQSKAIGAYLGISPKTVDFYLDRLKSKFSCYSKSQLIERAISEGYLNILPASLI